MSFQNIYYKRTTATARACFVCAKPTSACLATTNAVDFLYTCETHLSDSGFATELVDPASAASASASKPPAVSKEEIARVKAEWEAKEARKKTKESGKGAGAGKDESAGGGGEGTGEGGKNGAKSSSSSSPSPPVPGGISSSSSSSPPTQTQTHKRYSLHRDFYAMRQAEHRRRRQTKQVQELAPRLPGAPHGSF